MRYKLQQRHKPQQQCDISQNNARRLQFCHVLVMLMTDLISILKIYYAIRN